MCLLALFYRVLEDAPIVVGANREEFYTRGGEPPQLLGAPRAAVAGIDPVAGGTWFAVSERGVFIAVTNRPKSQLPEQPRSRGLLVRELLACSSAGEASERAARELSHNRYAGCNLVCADSDSAAIIHAGDWLRVRPLPPGLHVLTSHDANDTSDRRLAHALWWLSQGIFAGADQCVGALQKLCGQPGNGDPPICLRGERSGTLSSSIVALRTPLCRSTFLHAQGPPDRNPFVDFSHLFKELFSPRPT